MKLFQKISSTGQQERKLGRTGGWALLFLFLIFLAILAARVAGLIAGPPPAWYHWAVVAAGLAFSLTQILGLGWTLSFPLPLPAGQAVGLEVAIVVSILNRPPQNETQLVTAVLELAILPVGFARLALARRKDRQIPPQEGQEPPAPPSAS